MKINVTAIAEAKDPKFAIYKLLGSTIDEFEELYGNYVLLATYIRPSKTAGGIYLTEKNQEEDRYQGKAGLVLKLGQTAFEKDERYRWNNHPLPGEWVWYRPADTSEIGINGVSCRTIADHLIRGKIRNPQVIW